MSLVRRIGLEPRMTDYHRTIARIESTMLGTEDHGILTCYLFVDYGGSGQGIGGYALDEWKGPKSSEGRRVGTAYGMEFVARTMKACGVSSWEKVKGRTIFVLKDSDSWQAKVVGIENLPTERGERFIFEDLRQEFFGADDVSV